MSLTRRTSRIKRNCLATRNIANTLPDNEEDEKKHPAKSDRDVDIGSVDLFRVHHIAVSVFS